MPKEKKALEQIAMSLETFEKALEDDGDVYVHIDGFLNEIRAAIASGNNNYTITRAR